MEFTCNTKRLLAAVTACCRVAKRGPKPVLEYIHVTSSENTIHVLATDLERAVSLEVVAVIEEPGDCLIHANKLRAALATETSESVLVIASESKIELRGERSTMKWGVESSEFPVRTLPKGDASFTIQSSTLLAATRAVAWTADENETRYALGGVYIDVSGSDLNFVATNGKTLAAFGPIPASGKERFAILPASSVAVLGGVIPGTGETTAIITNNEVAFEFEGGWFSSCLINGRFPRWRDVFPSWQGESIEMPAGVLAGLISRCLLVREEYDQKRGQDGSYGTDLTFADGQLTAFASSAVGSSEATALIPQCKPISISLDSSYVAGVLRSMEPSNNVTIRLLDSESAAEFSQGLIRCVIMPLARG